MVADDAARRKEIRRFGSNAEHAGHAEIFFW
jgi:hypothetical protein